MAAGATKLSFFTLLIRSFAPQSFLYAIRTLATLHVVKLTQLVRACKIRACPDRRLSAVDVCRHTLSNGRKYCTLTAITRIKISVTKK